MQSGGSGTSSVPAATYDSGGLANNSGPPAPYPTSFSQIVELITTGQPVPGIKDIPDTILEGQASQVTSAKRKKPWEKDDTGNSSGDTMATI